MPRSMGNVELKSCLEADHALKNEEQGQCLSSGLVHLKQQTLPLGRSSVSRTRANTAPYTRPARLSLRPRAFLSSHHPHHARTTNVYEGKDRRRRARQVHPQPYPFVPQSRQTAFHGFFHLLHWARPWQGRAARTQANARRPQHCSLCYLQ